MSSPTDEIKSKLDIVEILSEYIQLKPAGSNLKALCPFHNEKTPSFMVSKEKQIWHCFGCSEGGDIFGFVMKMEGLEFPEALRLLAGKAGVVLKKQDPQLTSQKNRVLDVLNGAAGFYEQILWESPRGKAALAYLQNERKLTDESIRDWALGFAVEEWDSVLNFLQKKGFSEQEIFLAGMSVKKDKGAGYYDRFRSRIMFPIKDAHGQVVGFTGRVFGAEAAKEGIGKYVNTPQTIVYDKSHVLYGLNQAKTEIKKVGYTLLVEGNMDVITAAQAGFKNVVAASGTSLTEGQAQLLKRYNPNVIISFDMDEAGVKAALRGIEVLLSFGLNIKIMQLPRDDEGKPLYKDPDDCLKQDVELFKKQIKEAEGIMDFYFSYALTGRDLEKVDDKKEAARILLPVIAKIFDPVEQSYYLKKLSQALDTPEEYLRESIQKSVRSSVRPHFQKGGIRPSVSGGKQPRSRVEERLLGFCLKYPARAVGVFNQLAPEMFSDSELRELYKELIIYYTGFEPRDQWGEFFNYDDFREVIKKKTGRDQLLGELILSLEKDLDELSGEEEQWDIDKEIDKTVKRVRKSHLDASLKKLVKEIERAEQEGDRERADELSEDFRVLVEQRRSVE